MSHNISYVSSALSASNVSGDISAMQAAGATTYGDIFKEYNMQSQSLTTCGKQCYIKCSCNNDNGWFASNAGMGSSYVTATTKRAYAMTDTTSTSRTFAAASTSTPKQQTCYKKTNPLYYFDVYMRKADCDGYTCKLMVNCSLSNISIFNPQVEITGVGDPDIYGQNIGVGGAMCYNNGEAETRVAEVEQNFNVMNYLKNSDIMLLNEGNNCTWNVNNPGANGALGGNEVCSTDTGDYELRVHEGETTKGCNRYWYEEEPNKDYFRYKKETQNGKLCYQVYDCNSDNGYYQKMYGATGHTYTPQNYTCWERRDYYLDMYYSTSNGKIMAKCEIGYYNANHPVTIKGTDSNYSDINKTLTCGVTVVGSEVEITNTTKHNINDLKTNVNYSFNGEGANITLQGKYESSSNAECSEGARGCFKLRTHVEEEVGCPSGYFEDDGDDAWKYTFKADEKVVGDKKCYKITGCNEYSTSNLDEIDTSVFDFYADTMSGYTCYRANACNEHEGAYEYDEFEGLYYHVGSKTFKGQTCYFVDGCCKDWCVNTDDYGDYWGPETDLEHDDYWSKRSQSFTGNSEAGCMRVLGCASGYRQVGAAKNWRELKCESYYQDIKIEIEKSSLGMPNGPKVIVTAPQGVEIELGLGSSHEECYWGGSGAPGAGWGDIEECTCSDVKYSWTYNNAKKLNNRDTLDNTCNNGICKTVITTKSFNKDDRHYLKIDGESIFSGRADMDDADLLSAITRYIETNQYSSGKNWQDAVISVELKNGKKFNVNLLSDAFYYSRGDGHCQ